MKVTIRRVGLSSLGRMGCLLGLVAAFLPSLLCGILGLGLASVVRRWLESWQQVVIPLFGQEIARFDLVRLLGLESILEVLQVATTASVPILFLAVLLLALVCGLLLATIVVLVGLAYNLIAAATGGLVVEMAATGETPSSQARVDPN